MLVIFDCDGVLVDSEPLANRILAEHLTAIGLETTFEESVRDYMGRSWAAGVTLIEERLGRELPGSFGDRYFEALFDAFERELQPVAGIRAALDAIELPMCVASSGEPDKIRRSLSITGLLDRFDGRIFSASEVEHGKPAPDLFLHAADCVVVEDSPAGARAGRAAGMAVLGYARMTPAAQLAAEGARVFSSMDELPALLNGSSPRSGAARSA